MDEWIVALRIVFSDPALLGAVLQEGIERAFTH